MSCSALSRVRNTVLPIAVNGKHLLAERLLKASSKSGFSKQNCFSKQNVLKYRLDKVLSITVGG